MTCLAALAMAFCIHAQDTKVAIKTITTSPTTYYGSNTVSLAYDGNTSTFWHSLSIDNQITMTVTLKAVSHVDYVRYTPRQDGNTNGNWDMVKTGIW